MSHALFENIYVEKRAASDRVTLGILKRLGCDEPVYIDHYKDIFDRKKEGRNLILAHNPGKRLYEGAPVCQSFGNEHFYYSPGVMNCVYDCEYCFLKGMYPGKDMCIFTDLEETFKELEDLERQFPVYVCASYNTDLTAIEDITGFIAAWCERVRDHENLSAEFRTKCSRTDIYSKLSVSDSAVFAFTLSPDEIALKYEKGAPGPAARLKAASAAQEAGFPVRLCIDPMIYVRNWRDIYGQLAETIAGSLDTALIKDISIGSFRISDQYLKNMRKKMPDSLIAQYPYICEDGYYQYPEKVRICMEGFMKEALKKWCGNVSIFDWRS